jgi:hypothetical protein
MRKTKLSEAATLIAKEGGKATFKKYGKKHYVKMAKKRWGKSHSTKVKK